MKYLSVLGSTGSIGQNTLYIAEKFPDEFQIKALAAKSKVEILAHQIEHFKPEMAVVYHAEYAAELKRLLGPGNEVEILYGEKGYCAAAALDSVDVVVSAMVGAAGLKPTLAAIEAKKTIALANKETLVMAGEIVMQKAAENKVAILPIDSEHSAIFQCLLGNRKQDLQKILLTASGGPFFNVPKEDFNTITAEMALKHPNWSMGPKISIDSATLMNKGLEVIEAKHLFGVCEDRIEVVIHRQSVIHSMVLFKDGSVMAQLGIPDMRTAIAFALAYPQRLPLGLPEPDFGAIGTLTFGRPDTEKFPCLALAIQASRQGGTLPAVLNAANEVAVQAFLEHRVGFVQISELVQKTMRNHACSEHPSLADIIAADGWAREYAKDLIKNNASSI